MEPLPRPVPVRVVASLLDHVGPPGPANAQADASRTEGASTRARCPSCRLSSQPHAEPAVHPYVAALANTPAAVDNRGWCTKMLKLKPFEELVGDDLVITYLHLLADEN